MQFNLVIDQEQVVHCVWHGVSVRGYKYFGGVPAAFVAWACISPCGAFRGHLRAVLAVSGSFAY